MAAGLFRYQMAMGEARKKSRAETGMERPAEIRMPVRRMVLPLSEETEAVRADTSLEMAVWIPETVMLLARI